MTQSVLPPADLDLVQALRRGDEAALERLFRADYGALTSEAEATLHDARAAQRATTAAFVDLWRSRESIETPEGLDAMLRHALHEEVRDVHRRMASLHRHAKGADVVPTPDEAWEKVSAALHPAAVDVEAQEAARREAARHHAAAHVAELTTNAARNRWVAIGSFVTIVAIAIGATLWIDSKGDSVRASAALSSPKAVTIATNDGQFGELKIAGGGQARLGPASQLVIPDEFLTKVNALKVVGTAAIVLPPSEKPIEVRAGEHAVLANGSVTVRSYKDDGMAWFRLDAGTGSLAMDGTLTPMTVGTVYAVAANHAISPISGNVANVALGWTGRMYAVENRAVRDVLLDLPRWFGTAVQCNDEAVLARPISLNVSLDSPKAAIDAIAAAANAQISWRKGVAVLSDAGSKKP